MVFLFPTDFEAAKFRAINPDADVVICGVGMAAAAAVTAKILSENRALDWVVLAGIAGSYDLDRVAIDEVVEVCEESIEELPERFAVRYEIETRFPLRAVRSNSVNRSNFVGACSDIENMEGAAVAAICEGLQIKFSQIRAISNRVGDGVEMWSIESALDALTIRLTEIYISQR